MESLIWWTTTILCSCLVLANLLALGYFGICMAKDLIRVFKPSQEGKVSQSEMKFQNEPSHDVSR